ncbi:Long-chain-fatty-acid--CoA ligase 5 [Rhizophlyctis rosea]|uniref:Long-chain-fatty-acid--CoA ligase 5 n=1 Tax=Rhizophlyctis rosea TaxID=64517 RepID=A0AAD5SFF7_9FUNG|nr:Long-chain-fatty-acid--CoA ligase 5 [Rhizophlyctis rosea]
MAALQALQVDTLSVLLVPAVVLLGVLVSQKNRAPDVHPALLRQQSEISRTRNSAESAVLRNRQTPHGRPLTSSYDKSLKTTYDAFWNIVKTQPQRDLLGYKVGNANAWLSAEVLGKRVENLGAGLLQSTGVQSLQHDVDPESKNMVGILLSNSAEWAIADYACVTYSLVSVPIPTKAETGTTSHILSYTALSAIITSTAFAEKLFDNKNAYSNLKYIVLADVTDIPEQLLQRAQALNLSLLTLKEVESAGQANPKPHVPPQPDDIFTISFSTDPKSNGAMIPHSGVASAGAGILSMLPPSVQIASEDRHLSHLPLSSMYERSVVHAAVSAGCQVAFYDGTNVLHELKVADPTVIFTSAEILSKLANKIKVDYAINPPVEKLFHSIAFALKSWALSGGRVSKSGKVKFVMVDGSSSSDALTYARTALG